MSHAIVKLLFGLCFIGCSNATVAPFDETSAKQYLENVVKTYDIKDVAEVLSDCQPNLQEYITHYPVSLRAYFKDRLNYFIQNTALTIEEYLDLQYKTQRVGVCAVTVDRDWEEAFQAAAASQFLLPKEFKNPITINKYLSFLRGTYPLFEDWFRKNLHYILPLAADVMNIAENYRVYELIRDYYRAGKPPLSIVLAIKAAEEQKKREAEEWHFSDVLHWLPFSNRAPSTASSAPSSNEGTPPNGSFGSMPLDEKVVEQLPLLSAEEHRVEGLRKRR